MTDLRPLFHWSLPTPYPVSEEAIADARARGLSARLVRVLSRRGPVDKPPRSRRASMRPSRALNDPRALPDADRAVARVDAAVKAGERVLVLGDFDADGLTGLAVLVLALRYRGLDVEPYVPARTEEGHGLSRAAVEAAIAGGRTLILTADTGSTSHAEIEEARQAGIDVIVTDHHQLPGGPPDAAAVMNPHRADSEYPDTRLSGSGVAFKVAQLLLADDRWWPGLRAWTCRPGGHRIDRGCRPAGRGEPGHHPHRAAAPGGGSTAGAGGAARLGGRVPRAGQPRDDSRSRWRRGSTPSGGWATPSMRRCCCSSRTRPAIAGSW